jgi:dTMP kinase
MARARGKFITFEGLDGCGKSTQMGKLAEVLRAEGFEVLTTREPGGTAIGERIREVLLHSANEMDAMTELTLMFASRAQQIAEVIQPAVRAGKIVLCDRFTDSSEAYQGAGRELGSKTILAMHKIVCGGLQPDVTILMDSDPARSVERARRRNLQKQAATVDENRFEQESRAFFDRVHRQYLAIARRDRDRVVLVNARRPIATVHREIVEAVHQRLGVHRQEHRAPKS